jgi:hypothetical protein
MEIKKSIRISRVQLHLSYTDGSRLAQPPVALSASLMRCEKPSAAACDVLWGIESCVMKRISRQLYYYASIRKTRLPGSLILHMVSGQIEHKNSAFTPEPVIKLLKWPQICKVVVFFPIYAAIEGFYFYYKWFLFTFFMSLCYCTFLEIFIYASFVWSQVCVGVRSYSQLKRSDCVSDAKSSVNK